MEGYNPFPKKNFKPKPAGYYDCIFDKIEIFQRKKTVWEGKIPTVTNEMEDALRLHFPHVQEDGKVWTFRRDFSAAMGPNAHIRTKFAEPLGGPLLTEDIAKKREKFWDFLQALQGNEVTLRVGVSEDGNWNEILDIMPKRDSTITLNYNSSNKVDAPAKPESTEDRASRQESEKGKADFDDDDIPF